MSSLSLQEFKRVKYEEIDNLLKNNNDILIEKRGKEAFVVVRPEYYEYLKMCELRNAIMEAKEDIKNGAYEVVTDVKKYTQELEREIASKIENKK